MTRDRSPRTFTVYLLVASFFLALASLVLGLIAQKAFGIPTRIPLAFAALFMSMLVGTFTHIEVQTGKTFFKGGKGPIRREENPGCFWIIVLYGYAVAAGIAGVAILAFAGRMGS